MNISDIRSYVLPHVAGCPAVVADQKIVQAAIEFCSKTGVWRYDHPAVVAVETTPAYSFTPPSADTKVHRVLAAWLDGKKIDVKNATDMLGVNDWQTFTGTPSVLVVLDDAQFRLYPFGSGTIDMVVTLKPSRGAATIDDSIFERHVDAIADGALSILLGIPNKPWSNPQDQAYRRGEFDSAIGAATMAEFRHAPMRTVNPPL